MDTRIYREAVRVIIVKGDQVLLGREAYDENPKGKFNCFDFPGGGIEEGQTAEEAAIRECLEEVGIRIANPRPLGLEFYCDIEFRGEWGQKYKGNLDIWYVAEYHSQDSRLHNSEGDLMPYEWVSVEIAIEKISKGPYSPMNQFRLPAIKKVAEMIGRSKEVVWQTW